MTVVEFVICVPPLADVYHPRNVYPLALIVASEAYVEPYVTFIVDFDGVLALAQKECDRIFGEKQRNGLA